MRCLVNVKTAGYGAILVLLLVATAASSTESFTETTHNSSEPAVIFISTSEDNNVTSTNTSTPHLHVSTNISTHGHTSGNVHVASHATYCVQPLVDHHVDGIHVATWRWSEMRSYYAITLFIIIAGMAKLGFHYTHWLSSKIPESCLLILLGVLMGLVTYHLKPHDNSKSMMKTMLNGSSVELCRDNINGFLPEFTSELFFLVLLPPIVLEAAYSLHDKAFASNLLTILLYAVVGTILNMFIIGPILYLLASVGVLGGHTYPSRDNFDISTVSAVEIMTFASLIVAVDPVAVLAIFQEVGVNKDLYFLVFGESLLNDAVTVVLYNAMVSFASNAAGPIDSVQILLAVAAFLSVSLGGLAIGVVFGLLTALITRCTRDVPVVESLSLLVMAYLSYLTAELVHFSGIIATVACGVMQAHYAMRNISKNSCITIKYFISMASSTSDTIIFMFLGMMLVSDEHLWHTGFCLSSLILCLVVRFSVTYMLTYIANQYRMNKIGMKEQLIMAYGGLRGAVGFSLVVMLYNTPIQRDIVNVFVTCTLFIVLFTVFVQGSTIKLMVNAFGIKLDDHEEKTLAEEVITPSLDHLMTGVELIVGQGVYSRIKESLDRFDDRFMSRWLLVSPNSSDSLTEIYDRLVLEEHYASLYCTRALVQAHSRSRTHSISVPAAAGDDTRSMTGHRPHDGASLLNLSGLTELRRQSKFRGEPNSLLLDCNGAVQANFSEIARRLSSTLTSNDIDSWTERVHSGHLSRKRSSAATTSAASASDGRRRSSMLPFDAPNANLSVGLTAGRTRRSSVMDGMRNGVAVIWPLFGRNTHGDVENGQEDGFASITKPQQSDDKLTLRQAIRDNSFNKVQVRYNRTLMVDSDNHLETQLRRRRMFARRVSQMALFPEATTGAPWPAHGESLFRRAAAERHSMGATQRRKLTVPELPPIRNRSQSLEMSLKRERNNSATSACHDKRVGIDMKREPSPLVPSVRVNHGFVITEESDYDSDRTAASAGSSNSAIDLCDHGDDKASDSVRSSTATTPAAPVRPRNSSSSRSQSSSVVTSDDAMPMTSTRQAANEAASEPTVSFSPQGATDDESVRTTQL